MKEELQATYDSQDCKGIVNLCFSRGAYVSVRETPTGTSLTVHSEEKVPDKDSRYMQSVFATEKFQAIRKPRF